MKDHPYRVPYRPFGNITETNSSVNPSVQATILGQLPPTSVTSRNTFGTPSASHSVLRLIYKSPYALVTYQPRLGTLNQPIQVLEPGKYISVTYQVRSPHMGRPADGRASVSLSEKGRALFTEYASVARAVALEPPVTIASHHPTLRAILQDVCMHILHLYRIY